MKHFKIKLHFLAEEFFQFSLVTYLLLLLAEALQEGFVSYFFNLNILLVIILLSGLIMVITHTKQLDEVAIPHKVTSIDIQYTLLLATGGGFLVFYKTEALGDIAFVIAFLAGTIIMLLSLLILTDKKK